MEAYDRAVAKDCQEILFDKNFITENGGYNMRVKAARKTRKGNKFIYWAVFCAEKFGDRDDDHSIHPFRHFDIEEHNEQVQWGIIAENTVTKKLLELISLPNKELYEKVRGSTCPDGTRARYIKILDMLWD